VSKSRPAIETATGRDYGATRALDSLQLTVASGALVGLLGPNGAGKTDNHAGAGHPAQPSRARPACRTTSSRAVCCSPKLDSCSRNRIDGLLTVEENLLFAARLSGLRTKDARNAVKDALSRTRLGSGRATRATTLRLAKARGYRASDRAPPHPSHPRRAAAGLDPEHRDRMWTPSRTTARARGTTILFPRTI
jgi:ABC-2 type transport system ATP-binding protein